MIHSINRCALIVMGLTLLNCGSLPAQDAPTNQPATQPAFSQAGPPSTAPTTRAATKGNAIHNVTLYGAVGDGTAIDSPAINKAIEAAAAVGGGTVYFPPGTYLSYSIRLKSNITLQLDQGATILAAYSPADGQPGGYDAAEPNQWSQYQDAGHSHWHNTLIWGDELTNVSIVGPGMIDGRGLGGAAGGGGGRGGGPGGGRRGGGRGFADPTSQPTTADFGGGGGRRGRGGGGGRGPEQVRAGTADKAIALRLCRNVTLRDITLYRGGHFCILATGADNFTLDNVTFDTNRDGIDIDCCRNVRVSNCTVNAPNDDGLCLKTSYALGELRPCENITITNCLLSGFEIGSAIDATYKVLDRQVPDRMGPTGRIKFGTESAGDFKNITISNCVFDHCRGLALETVDGANLEDVTITNITMRETSNSPIFLRLGTRMRAPEGTPIGKLRRVNISNIVASNADSRFASIISGNPNGVDIEDIKLSNIRIQYKGGGTKEQAAIQPPDNEGQNYPEPQRLGEMPAYGFYIRHVKGIEMSDIKLTYINEDQRPPFVLQDVSGAKFENIDAPHVADAPVFILKGVENFQTRQVKGVTDGVKEKVVDGKE